MLSCTCSIDHVPTPTDERLRVGDVSPGAVPQVAFPEEVAIPGEGLTPDGV
jgi:hypothetical protein